MQRTMTTLTTGLGLMLLSGCSALTPQGLWGTRAQLFEGLVSHRRTITTDSARAQQYFDQGLIWSYVFNHGEAIRSFKEAARLDPDCAMAWWGVALCQGPNYNLPKMNERRNAASWNALQSALARIDNASPVERALIAALSHRYAKPWPKDRTELEQAYANAMAKVWAAYPNDSDVGTLYAEAMMIQTPWKLYALDYTPAENTPKILAVLERVMEMDPGNPGANHLYVHAVEPSARPERGLVAADRLCDMVPSSGHLQHMPSHIYVKTGRWERAVVQNEKAMSADATYRQLSPKPGVQYWYMTHNAHMLAYAAMMSGRERDAMSAARAMWKDVPDDALRKLGPYVDKWMCSVYDVQKRFGRWDDILEEKPPPSFLPITTAIWRAHRAVAYAAKKDFDHAKREYEEFRRAKAAIPDDVKWGRNVAQKVLDVSDYFIAGEIALQKGNWAKAAELLEKSAAVEDTLGYGEPPQWLQPIRHTLGAVYLKNARYADAERVYRQDLAKWPDNGWSLYGLSRALQRQGKMQEASQVEREYRRAWAHADEPTTTSCKCIPKT